MAARNEIASAGANSRECGKFALFCDGGGGVCDSSEMSANSVLTKVVIGCTTLVSLVVVVVVLSGSVGKDGGKNGTAAMADGSAAALVE